MLEVATAIVRFMETEAFEKEGDAMDVAMDTIRILSTKGTGLRLRFRFFVGA